MVRRSVGDYGVGSRIPFLVSPTSAHHPLLVEFLESLSEDSGSSGHETASIGHPRRSRRNEGRPLSDM